MIVVFPDHTHLLFLSTPVIVLLTIPRMCFLWILFVIYVSRVFLLYCLVSSLYLVITWEMAELMALLCLMFPLCNAISICCLGLGVVLDYIDS